MPRTKRPKPCTLKVDAATSEDVQHTFAKLATSGEFAAMRVLQAGNMTAIGDRLDLSLLVQTLREQGEAVNNGDLSQAEGMLINQAVALQNLFARLVECAMSADLMAHYEAHLRLGLRAQAQCTRTLEVLAGIKNPPVVIAKQANIAQGHQQVNNGVPASDPPRAREVEPMQNKLLEELPHERLDTGTAATTSRSHSEMETVGAVHRSEDGGREGAGIPQSLQGCGP